MSTEMRNEKVCQIKVFFSFFSGHVLQRVQRRHLVNEEDFSSKWPVISQDIQIQRTQ